MKLLALDTSTLTAGVGVAFGDGETPARVVTKQAQVTKHSDMILALVDEALKEAGITIRDIDVIACGAGPGSFTGLRIGMATAKGLCLARECPFVTVSSLAVLGARGPRGVRTVAVLDAYKNEVYVGCYRDAIPEVFDEKVVPPDVVAPELAKLVASEALALVGDGLDRYPQLLVAGATRVDTLPAPRAEELVRLAWERAWRKEFATLDDRAPTYIRPSEAEIVAARKKL